MTYKLDIMNFFTKGLIRETDASSNQGYHSVINFADLPDPLQHTGETYLVQNVTGIWPFNFKQKGLYRSNGIDWNYLGIEYDTTSIKIGEITITASPITLSSSDSNINFTANSETKTIDMTIPALSDIKTVLAAILGG